MTNKLQKIITNVTCPLCSSTFGLSESDSAIFLRKMHIELECPICNKLANLSVIPKIKKNLESVAQKSSQVKIASKPATKSRIGTPSFQPLIVSQPCIRKEIDPFDHKIPFAPLSEKQKLLPAKPVPIKYIIAVSSIVFLCCIGLGIWMFNKNDKTTDNKVFKQETAKKTVLISSESQLYPEGQDKP